MIAAREWRDTDSTLESDGENLGQQPNGAVEMTTTSWIVQCWSGLSERSSGFHRSRMRARKHFLGLAIGWGVLFVPVQSNAAEPRLAEPMLMQAHVESGQEQGVCADYAKAIEQTVFNQFPHCGRWSVSRLSPFTQIESRPLLAEEYEGVYDQLAAFFSPGNVRKRTHSDTSARTRALEEYREWYAFDRSFEARLGQELIVRPRPAQWLLVSMKGGRRLLLLDGSSSDCGLENSNERIGRARVDLLVVAPDGSLEVEQTRKLLQAAINNNGAVTTNAKANTSNLDLTGHAFGAFSYKGNVYFDAFGDISRKNIVSGSNRFEGIVAVYSFPADVQSLTPICKIKVAERKRPWRFAK